MLKTLFIINPISGLGKQKDLPQLVDRYLDKTLFSHSIRISEYAGHARVLASQLKDVYDIMVAVGGDGTINEIAGSLINSNTSLGVIPLGSGNGLGRHLHISTNPVKAIQQLNTSKPTPFDAGFLNGKPFFNVSGTGFDAQISKKFSKQLKRGYVTYARCVLEEIQLYKPKRYRIQIADKVIEDEFFFIAFANTAQYGNNAFVAPDAATDDGLLDIVLVKPFPIVYFPAFTVLGMSRSLSLSSYVQTFKANEVTIQNLQQAPVHLDGEYEGSEDLIRLEVQKQVLKIMSPH